jgi:hypothetical protein
MEPRDASEVVCSNSSKTQANPIITASHNRNSFGALCAPTHILSLQSQPKFANLAQSEPSPTGV